MVASGEFASHRRSIYVSLRTTNLGMIMSASLALLAYNVFKYPDQNNFADELARAVCSFIVIIWVTMEYVSYSMVQDRYPSWKDAIQLHLLGVGQIACSVYVGNLSRWMLSSLFMAFIGIWCYWSQRPKEGEFPQKVDLIYPEVEPTVRKNIWYALGCCAVSLLALALYYFQYFPNSTMIPIQYDYLLFPNSPLLLARSYYQLFPDGALIPSVVTAITWREFALILPYVAICVVLRSNTNRIVKEIVTTTRARRLHSRGWSMY